MCCTSRGVREVTAQTREGLWSHLSLGPCPAPAWRTPGLHTRTPEQSSLAHQSDGLLEPPPRWLLGTPPSLLSPASPHRPPQLHTLLPPLLPAPDPARTLHPPDGKQKRFIIPKTRTTETPEAPAGVSVLPAAGPLQRWHIPPPSRQCPPGPPRSWLRPLRDQHPKLVSRQSCSSRRLHWRGEQPPLEKRTIHSINNIIQVHISANVSFF